jgi:hypothetical protein
MTKQQSLPETAEIKKELLNLFVGIDTCFASTKEQERFCEKNCEGYGCPIWEETANKIIDIMNSLLSQKDKEINELKAKTEWVSVKDRLPENDDVVFNQKLNKVFYWFRESWENQMGDKCEKGKWYFRDEDGYYHETYVSHWMLLPLPPTDNI